MKRTRTGRLARLWAVLPFVGKHIAERFGVRRARLYVLKGGETGFALHGLCSITFIKDTDPGYAVEWLMHEDYEDVEARGGDRHETGRISATTTARSRCQAPTGSTTGATALNAGVIRPRPRQAIYTATKSAGDAWETWCKADDRVRMHVQRLLSIRVAA